ncbi:uncharacterized protein LOC144327471 isoform X2 [Podarcis muralis]
MACPTVLALPLGSVRTYKCQSSAPGDLFIQPDLLAPKFMRRIIKKSYHPPTSPPDRTESPHFSEVAVLDAVEGSSLLPCASRGFFRRQTKLLGSLCRFLPKCVMETVGP